MLLTLVVASAKTAGALANRVHQPSVFGEILVGLLLGPTLFNVLGWPIFASAAGTPGVPLIDLVRDLAQIGSAARRRRRRSPTRSCSRSCSC